MEDGESASSVLSKQFADPRVLKGVFVIVLATARSGFGMASELKSKSSRPSISSQVLMTESGEKAWSGSGGSGEGDWSKCLGRSMRRREP